MSNVSTDHLRALGQSASTEYAYDRPAPEVLEVFASPFDPKTAPSVKIAVPEFTSLCPKTGQPDFAMIIIEYRPDKLCVESKSLKLYMMSFRNHGEFHEACVARITNDLVALLDPVWLKVEGRFTPRGGIPFWPTCSYLRPHSSGRLE